MKVKVVDYNPKWLQQYNIEQQLLLKKMGDVVISIHHIGSTSIPGMSAKAIIDILIEVSSLSRLDDKDETMLSLGYASHGEYGIVGRRYYTKGSLNRSHQIHVFVRGDNNILRHIAFRDYIQAHPAIAKNYADLKIRLAIRFPDSIDDYCDGKNSFIKQFELEAVTWLKSEK